MTIAQGDRQCQKSSQIYVGSKDNVEELVREAAASGEAFSEIRVGSEGEFIVARAGGPVRPCGTCYACCVLPGINDLKKPPHRPCQHLRHRHRAPTRCCSIHERRPDPCKSFFCSWAMGNFAEDDQPNKIGTIVGIFPHEGAMMAAIMVDGKSANMDRVSSIFRYLTKLFPRVQVVVDDKDVAIAEGGRLQTGSVLPRPRGDFESTIIATEER